MSVDNVDEGAPSVNGFTSDYYTFADGRKARTSIEGKKFRIADPSRLTHVVVAETKVDVIKRHTLDMRTEVWRKSGGVKVKTARFTRYAVENLHHVRALVRHTAASARLCFIAGDIKSNRPDTGWTLKNSKTGATDAEGNIKPVTITGGNASRLGAVDLDKPRLDTFLGGMFTPETFPGDDPAMLEALARHHLPEGIKTCALLIHLTASHCLKRYAADGTIEHTGPHMHVFLFTDRALTLGEQKILFSTGAHLGDKAKDLDGAAFSTGQWIFTATEYNRTPFAHELRGRAEDVQRWMIDTKTVARSDPYEDVRLFLAPALAGFPDDGVVDPAFLEKPKVARGVSRQRVLKDAVGNEVMLNVRRKGRRADDFDEAVAGLSHEHGLYDALREVVGRVANDLDIDEEEVRRKLRVRRDVLVDHAIAFGRPERAPDVIRYFDAMADELAPWRARAVAEFLAKGAPSIPTMTADEAAARVSVLIGARVDAANERARLLRRVVRLYRKARRRPDADVDRLFAAVEEYRDAARRPALVVKVTPGVGKTEALINAAARVLGRVIIVVPTHRLAKELVERFRGGYPDLSVARYCGIGEVDDGCELYRADPPAFRAYLGAKGSMDDVCVGCSRKATCRWFAQDLTRTRIVVVAGNTAHMAPLPKKVKGTREDRSFRVTHAARLVIDEGVEVHVPARVAGGFAIRDEAGAAWSTALVCGWGSLDSLGDGVVGLLDRERFAASEQIPTAAVPADVPIRSASSIGWQEGPPDPGSVLVPRFAAVFIDETLPGEWFASNVQKNAEPDDETTQEGTSLTSKALKRLLALDPPTITEDDYTDEVDTPLDRQLAAIRAQKERGRGAVADIRAAAEALLAAIDDADGSPLEFVVPTAALARARHGVEFAYQKPNAAETASVAAGEGRKVARMLIEKARTNRALDDLKALATAVEAGGFVRYDRLGEHDWLHFDRLGKLHRDFTGPETIITDATAVVPILERIWPRLEVAEAAAVDAPGVRRHFVDGGPTSSQLTQATAGDRLAGFDYGDELPIAEVPERKERERRSIGPALGAFIRWRRKVAGGRVVGYSSKDAAAALSPIYGEGNHIHQGAVRGLDEFKDAVEHHVIGRLMLDPLVIVSKACWAFGCTPDDLARIGERGGGKGRLPGNDFFRLERVPILIRRHDGSIGHGRGWGYRAADRRVQAILDATTGSTLVQVDGRARACRAEGAVTILHLSRTHADGLVYEEGEAFDLDDYDPTAISGRLIEFAAAGKGFRSPAALAGALGTTSETLRVLAAREVIEGQKLRDWAARWLGVDVGR